MIQRTLLSILLVLTFTTSRALSNEDAGDITIITKGKISIQKGTDGVNHVSVNFEGRESSKPKTYKTSQPYTLDLVGAVRETKTHSGLKLEVLSLKEFKQRFPQLASKGSAENPCGFMNNGGFKFCFDPECPHMPPNWHCILHAAGNYCACEQK